MAEQKIELIIIKRIEEVADAKKGGAWKVAHADFMTAMMAFFLIMWLVNATDDEIKKSIANYFNPMNLMDAPTDRRGVMDPTKETQAPASGDEAGQAAGARPLGSDTPGEGGAAGGGGNVEAGNENHMDSSGILEQSDGAAFNDPYATLASAAAEIAPEEPVAVDVPQSTIGATGQTTISDAPRDPFDPTYWQTTSPRPARSLRPGPTETADEAPPQDQPMDATDRRPTETQSTASRGPDPDARADEPATAIAAHQSDVPSEPSRTAHRSAMAAAVLATLDDETSDAAAASPSQEAAEGTEAEKAARLKVAANSIATELTGLDADVTVSSGETSVLISLTDDGPFSMFAIGSATPTAQTSVLFASVAAALATRDGRIVVRGHTDSRQFATGTSDNWMLSFSRAHATKKALVSNGVAESRIARVEGLADREPSNRDNPLADENRRIEILYEPAAETP